ncbi:MAG: hypothetical protein WBL59_07330, partial [Bacillota bacterium]
IIARELVDRQPGVSSLRNRIDNLENYERDLPKAIREDKYRCRLEMAKRMKPDVLRLMGMRNSLAVKQGYASYVDLVLHTDEVDKSKLVTLLNEHLKKNLVKAREPVKRYNMSFESWFEDLKRISDAQDDYDVTGLIDRLLGVLGWNVICSGFHDGTLTRSLGLVLPRLRKRHKGLGFPGSPAVPQVCANRPSHPA